MAGLSNAKAYLKKYRKRSIWHRALTCMAAVVVFCTTYALVLPALTLEVPLACTLEEHVHGDECYTQLTEATTCTLESLDVHEHTEDCYDLEGNVICGYADFVVHQHDDTCRDANGNLWCTLPEIEAHTHDESCYAEPSEGTEALPPAQDEANGANEALEQGELICTESTEPHTHTEECYTKTETLVCEIAESDGHQHDESCLDENGEVACGLEESEGHQHGPDCYEETSELTCELSEEAHQHTEACYAQKTTLPAMMLADLLDAPAEDAAAEPELICDKEEIILHEHTEECFDEDGNLICEQLQVLEHVHSEACLQSAEDFVDPETLSCTIEEGAGAHKHSAEAGCYDEDGQLICQLEESEGHQHSARCYGTWVLTCELEEHTHSDDCYAKPQYVCGKEEHQHGEGCHDAEGKLICGKEEHTHDESCLDYDHSATDTLWREKMSQVELTDDWGANVAALAQSQLGYHEDTKDVMQTEDGKIHGYTYFGAYYEAPYADWNAIFASYCIAYAGIDSFPLDDDPLLWQEVLQEEQRYYTADEYLPKPGDLVFFYTEPLTEAENLAETEPLTENLTEAETLQVGLVCEVIDNEDGSQQIVLIAGDVGDSVQQLTFAIDDTSLAGYGELPINPEKPMPDNVDAFARLVPEEQGGFFFQLFATTREGENVVNPNEIDFTNWINDATIQHRQNDGDDWEEIPDGGDVDISDQIRFKLAYTVPGGELSPDKKTITYQIPRDQIHFIKTATGKVFNDATQEVGTYQIDQNGKISITFYDNYVKSNQEHAQAISGTISFQSNVSEIGTGKVGKIELPFKDGVKVTVNVRNKEAEKADLNVRKTAGDPNNAKGTVDYTIVVKSERGTGEAVTLTDIMDKIGLEGDIQITAINASTDGAKINKTDQNHFTVTLPQMGPNSTYTITYTAKLPNNSTATTDVKNKVTVSSKDKSGISLEDSSEVSTQFRQVYIEKYGQLLSDGKIQWTITVNKEKNDIGGWILSDILNGQPFTGLVNIEPAVDNGKGQITNQIALPYKFPDGCKEAYTITYTTDTDKPVGNNPVKNEAILENPEDNSQFSSGENNVWAMYNPMSKKAESLTENPVVDGEKTATITWNVTINANQGPIAAPWTYKDELWNGQWFTGKQLKDLKAALDASVQNVKPKLEYTIVANKQNPPDSIGSEVQFDQVIDTERYKVYSIKFTTPLERGQSFTYQYTSTAPLGDGSSAKEFQNKANIDNKVWSEGKIPYEPTVTELSVRKEDNKAHNAAYSSHDYYDDNLKFGEERGFLEWLVTVTIPNNYNGRPLTVTEHLPDGLELKYLEIWADGVFDKMDITTDRNGKENPIKAYNGTLHEIDKHQSGSTVTITIPESLAKNENLKEIRILVRVKIPDDYVWKEKENGKPKDTFKNQVTVESQDGKTRGIAEQTQTIIKDDSKEVLKKVHIHKSEGENGETYGDNEYENNIIPYELTINPDGKDLLEGADTLTLVDKLSHNYDASKPFNMSLVPNSVQAFVRNSDGSQGAKVPISYTYTLGGEAWHPVYTLEITIPDSKPLIVKYAYKASSTLGRECDLSNQAYLEGYTSKGKESNDSVKLKVIDSAASANLQGVTIYKVDSEKNTIALGNAKFHLYRYNDETKTYELITKTVKDEKTGTEETVPAEYITVADGETKGFLSLTLDFNTAYQLVEVKAPDGYKLNNEPYEFIIANADTERYQVHKPDNFSGTEHSAGETIFFGNKPDKTSIQVQKKWFDSDGKEIVKDADSGAVTFDLYQIASTTPPNEGEIVDPNAETAMVTVESVNRYDSTLTRYPVKTANVPIGAIVTVEFEVNAWNGGTNFLGIRLNDLRSPLEDDKLIKESECEKGTFQDDVQKYKYSFELEGDTHVFLIEDANPRKTAEITFATQLTPEYGKPLADLQGIPYKKGCTISGPDWICTINDLPKKGKNADGQLVYYAYYVKEVNAGTNYTTNYIKNHGIATGTITIMNTETEQPTYLPNTGGPGVRAYTTAGLLLMMAAAVVLFYRKNTRRKEDSASS